MTFCLIFCFIIIIKGNHHDFRLLFMIFLIFNAILFLKFNSLKLILNILFKTILCYYIDLINKTQNFCQILLWKHKNFKIIHENNSIFKILMHFNHDELSYYFYFINFIIKLKAFYQKKIFLFQFLYI